MSQICDRDTIQLELIRLDPGSTGLDGARFATALQDRFDSGEAVAIGDAPRLLRLVQPVNGLDPLSWLAGLATPERLYWRSRDDRREVAGAGFALRRESTDLAPVTAWIRSLTPIESGPDAPPGPGLLGTLRFAPTPARGEWAAFGTACAYLPRIEVHRTDDRVWAALNLILDGPDPEAELARALDAIGWLDGAPKPPKTPRLVARTDPRKRERWDRSVQAVLDRIESGVLEKAVLARTEDIAAERPIPPLSLLTHLVTAQPGTYRFCLQIDRDHGFLGASPEMLYLREGRSLRSEAVAGTRARASESESDQRLAEELRTSTKDLEEHRLVHEHIVRSLTPLCSELEGGNPPEIHPLASVQHLRTEISGMLKEDVNDHDLLSALHPTPAVCGLPADAAAAAIDRLEEFDRGLYGGLVGWFGSDEVECAVALRCGLVRGRTLRLFAGAGIVSGSTAEAEWAETASKLSTFRSIHARID